MNTANLKIKSFQNIQVPALGLGTWQLNGKECIKSVADAIDIGYRHIDTAKNYSNEAEVGKGINEAGIKRENLFITTKIPPEELHANQVKRVANESLENLQLDYIDLLLIHWPNDTIPLDETLGAMQELKDEGKIKLIGISNFNTSLMDEAVSITDIFCNQVEYHPFLDQDAVLKKCREDGLMLTAYSPVAKGRVMRDETIKTIAEKYGKTPAQVALRWLLQQDNVVAIPRSSTHEHRKQNFEIWDFDLANEDMGKISALRGNKRLIDPGWAPSWD